MKVSVIYTLTFFGTLLLSRSSTEDTHFLLTTLHCNFPEGLEGRISPDLPGVESGSNQDLPWEAYSVLNFNAEDKNRFSVNLPADFNNLNNFPF